MNSWRIFAMRAVLGVVGGVVLARAFFPDASPVLIISLCLVLVGLAYLSEYLRQRKSKP